LPHGCRNGWHEHDDGVFHGCEKFFRPAYDLVSSRIPSLRDVKEKLEAGARVADAGCGRGPLFVQSTQDGFWMVSGVLLAFSHPPMWPSACTNGVGTLISVHFAAQYTARLCCCQFFACSLATLPQRMTRSRCGSLGLHRTALSSAPPLRFISAQSYWNQFFWSARFISQTTAISQTNLEFL